MRESKFRAWVKLNNDIQKYSGMYEVEGLDFLNHLVKVKRASIFAPQIFRFDECDLLQYIGLKDKNRVEGYFDDLVQWGKAIYKIVWDEDEGIARLQYVRGKEVFGTLRISQLKDCAIIGNIHENKELLNEPSNN